MTRLMPLLAGVCLALVSAPAARAADRDLEALEEQAIKQAAAVVAPSMVRIETVGGLDRVGQVLTGTGPTTGVIVSPDGFIISSAFNFISRPASILVTLPDGRRMPATQVATDKLKMLTLLKVDADNQTPAIAAPAESFRVGQWAIALGRTYDDTIPSVSVGIVGALKRIWGKAIQTDAKVSPVNYGGPLADIQGRVLGILVPLSTQGSGEVAGFEWYDSGIGFAIPLADVYASLDRLKTGTDLLPGLMGVTVKTQDIYEGSSVIDRVRYGSPAQQAGIREGDTIVELDGQTIHRQAQVLHALGTHYAGDKLSLKVKRGADVLPLELTLTDKLVPYESAFLGILPDRDAPQDAESGAGIRAVLTGSPAEAAGLERGQKIMKFNGTPVAGSAALLDAVSRLRPAEKCRLSVQAGDQQREVEIVLGSLPETVPEDLRPVAIPTRAADLPDKTLRLGRFTDKLPGHDNDYWAYVPEDYNPAYRYGLVVWLHPGGDTMEAAMVKDWKALCDRRGLILLAPKARQISGWSEAEGDFIKELTDHFQEKYSTDPARAVMHGFGDSGQFACQLAFKHRQTWHGACTIASPLREQPPDNEPESRFQFYLVSGDADPLHRQVVATAAGLKGMKYPVVHKTIAGGAHEYPGKPILEEIARWLDALDRI